MGRILARRQLNLTKIFPSDDRRIDQRAQRYRVKINHVAVPLGAGKRGPVFPSVRKLQTWRKSDVANVEAFGIKQNLIPAQQSQGIGGRRARRISRSRS